MEHECVAAIILQSSSSSSSGENIVIMPLTVCDILQWCPTASTSIETHSSPLVQAIRRLEPVIVEGQEEDNGAALFSVAIESGHVDAVKQGMRCNSVAEKNHALIVACTFGHTDVVQAILDNAPCTIKYVDKHGRTPLHIAAMHGHVCLIRLLLKHDATLVNVLDHESHDSVD
eukprot:PhF_6_TR13028/c1_g3_i16/m.20670